MSNLSVRYVGQKTQRADTVAGTGLTWYGHGDIQSVPLAAWDKLKRHPDVWELVDTTTEAPKAEGTLGAASAADGSEDTSATASEETPPADRDAIVAQLEARGIKFDKRIKDVAKLAALLTAEEA
jgi:hypothetical protein